MERFKQDCNIQSVISSLSSEPLGESKNFKQFEDDSTVMIESLDSLNKSMKEFEDGAKSIMDKLTDYRYYKETLDDLNSLLEKSKSDGCDPQFLDLMSCDWACYLGAIQNDIQQSKSIYYTLSLYAAMCYDFD